MEKRNKYHSFFPVSDKSGGNKEWIFKHKLYNKKILIIRIHKSQNGNFHKNLAKPNSAGGF